MQQFSTSPENQAKDKAACHVQVTVEPCDGVIAFVEIRAYRSPQAGLVPSKLVARQALREALREIEGREFSRPSVSLKDCPQAAINFGDDVATAPPQHTVPVGNTGTPSTGAGL